MLKKSIIYLKRYVSAYVQKSMAVSLLSSGDSSTIWKRMTFAYFTALFSSVGVVSTLLLILFFLSRDQYQPAIVLISLFLCVSIFTIFNQIPELVRIKATVLLFSIFGLYSLVGFETPVVGLVLIFIASQLSVLFYGFTGFLASLKAKLSVFVILGGLELSGLGFFSEYAISDFLMLSLVFIGIDSGVSIPIVVLQKYMTQSLKIGRQYKDMLSTKHKQYLVAMRKSEESELLKSAFLANMSHEIRTPMNAILGFSNLLSHPGVCAEEKVKFVELINQNAQNLMLLLDDIIDVSKMDSGQVDVKNTPVQLDELMSEIHSHFIAEARRKSGGDIKIFYRSSAPADLTVLLDGQRLRQVLYQLVGNALKFTDRGFIEFGFSIEDGHTLLFHVKDTGIGIPYGREEDVFKRFSKFNQNRNRLFGGIGIGLSIAQNIVKMMGGRIWVEPQSGKGAMFYFTLPLHRVAQKSSLIDTTTVKPEMFNWQGRTFLIAEDEEDNFRYIEVALSFSNANLIWARDGKEAVDMFRNKRDIDLVLMDIKMPRLDGYSATKQIRQFSDVPVIAQTAYTLNDERERLLKAGCDDFIAKPIGYNDLLYTIHKYVPSLSN